jgi:hypothetical protein
MLESTALHGGKEIMAYTGRRWKILLEWHKELHFPMIELNGAWESDTALIDTWRREQILRVSEEKWKSL